MAGYVAHKIRQSTANGSLALTNGWPWEKNAPTYGWPVEWSNAYAVFDCSAGTEDWADYGIAWKGMPYAYAEDALTIKRRGNKWRVSVGEIVKEYDSKREAIAALPESEFGRFFPAWVNDTWVIVDLKTQALKIRNNKVSVVKKRSRRTSSARP